MSTKTPAPHPTRITANADVLVLDFHVLQRIGPRPATVRDLAPKHDTAVSGGYGLVSDFGH